MSVRPNPRSWRNALSVMLILILAGATAGCAEFAEWITFDSTEKADARAKADAASLWEMTLMAGRYGVMLDQAREILNLPEPTTAPVFPPNAGGDVEQRKALAVYQVTVVDQFFADAARACKKRRVPAKVRSIACKDQKQLAVNLRTPVAPEMPALSSRNDQVGNVITPWWDAVCKLAPKPKAGDVPACALE